MFRYPGGKSKLKKKIARIIGSYYYVEDCYETCCYVEPFFGGGAIGRELFNITSKVAINDYDIGVASFWHSIINSPDEMCNYVLKFKPSVEHFYEYKSIFLQENLRSIVLDEKKYPISYVGFMKMALHQISFSGLGVKSGGPLGGASQKSKYKIDCRWNPEYIKKKILKYHHKLKEINIFNNTCGYDDFFCFIEKVLNNYDQNFIYLDPPYYKKGPELYQFFFNGAQHKKLAKLLRKINCPWLLSYDYSEEIRELYKWAEIIEVNINCTVNTKSGAISKKEFLIIDKKYKYLLDGV